MTGVDTKWTLARNGGLSLDLEIIAQGEAEEKNEGDRNDVLHNHQHLNA